MVLVGDGQTVRVGKKSLRVSREARKILSMTSRARKGGNHTITGDDIFDKWEIGDRVRSGDKNKVRAFFTKLDGLKIWPKYFGPVRGKKGVYELKVDVIEEPSSQE